jgi:hypothetical protein
MSIIAATLTLSLAQVQADRVPSLAYDGPATAAVAGNAGRAVELRPVVATALANAGCKLVDLSAAHVVWRLHLDRSDRPDGPDEHKNLAHWTRYSTEVEARDGRSLLQDSRSDFDPDREMLESSIRAAANVACSVAKASTDVSFAPSTLKPPVMLPARDSLGVAVQRDQREPDSLRRPVWPWLVAGGALVAGGTWWLFERAHERTSSACSSGPWLTCEYHSRTPGLVLAGAGAGVAVLGWLWHAHAGGERAMSLGPSTLNFSGSF